MLLSLVRWVVGAWGGCSSRCGLGLQQRLVGCAVGLAGRQEPTPLAAHFVRWVVGPCSGLVLFV